MISCPTCGTALALGRLEIPEDDGSVGKLFTFDCPNRDYYGTLVEAEMREIFTREIVKRLKQNR